MTAPLDLTQPEELRDYVWETRGTIHIETKKLLRDIPGISIGDIHNAIDYATTEGPIDYKRLGFYIETHLPEVEE